MGMRAYQRPAVKDALKSSIVNCETGGMNAADSLSTFSPFSCRVLNKGKRHRHHQQLEADFPSQTQHNCQAQAEVFQKFVS